MALPTSQDAKQAWPPGLWNPIAHKHRLWSAWYSGEPSQLSWAYLNLGANSQTGRAFFRTTGETGTTMARAGRSRGGLLGSVDRTFWGTSPSPGEKRNKIHVPLAGDIASMSADLLFGKRARFEAPDSDRPSAATKQWLDDRFDDDLHATLLEGGELCAALGGIYLRTAWDTQLSDRPWIDLVHADGAIPEFRGNKLATVTFWRILSDEGGDVHRHLEQHDLTTNSIYHGVYVGDQVALGQRVPVADYPQLEPLMASLDQDEAIHLPDLPPDASTVTYIPNMRPNRTWRDIAHASALGRSDFHGSEGLMDTLDETYSSWERDIRLARSRLIVPPEYLDDLGPGKGAIADVDREIFTPLNMLAGSADASQITPSQFAIRWEEHLQSITETVNMIVRSAGYSPQTFGDAPNAAMTATEIEDRQRRTLLTRAKKQTYWRPGLADVLYSLMWIEKTTFGRSDLTPVRPDVVFPDAVLPSSQELAQTAVALSTAQAASKQTLIALVHPDWTPEQIDEEVQRMRDEAGFDILGRARTTLAEPMGSTANLGQEIQQIANSVRVTPEQPTPINPDRELTP